MSPWFPIIWTIFLLRIVYSLSYGCFMDGCNPQRDFCLGGASVPYLNKQSLKLNWTFTTVNFTTNTTNNTFINNIKLIMMITYSTNVVQYLGCTTNVENGISNAVTCLFQNGLFTLSENGELLWSYPDPIVSSEIGNISSIPLLLPYDTTIVDTGTHIMAFNDGVFDWQEMISNLSISANTVSKWSVGFVEPQYFSITLTDGRLSVYDYSQGMCWASLYLTHKNQQYKPIAVTSSINTLIYVIDNDITEYNILTVVDIEGEYILPWYIFDTENKCVGQLSATTDDCGGNLRGNGVFDWQEMKIFRENFKFT